MCFFTRRLRAVALVVAAAVGLAVAAGGAPLKDSRDGKTYKTVVIGGKRWMAENLNYKTSDDSRCYNNDNSYCNKYGRLYGWAGAWKACPMGWHLPTRAEWNDLGQAVGGQKKASKNGSIDWEGAGKKLKAKNGWKDNGNGTDEYGFSALPGGEVLPPLEEGDDKFSRDGKIGNWWTYEYVDDMTEVWIRSIFSDKDFLSESWTDPQVGEGYSVRCVADN